MILLTILLVPTLIALGFLIFGQNKVTLGEFLLQCAIQTAVLGLAIFLVSMSDTSDTEIWNGKVVKKEREKVSCEHSYSCNCYESCSSNGKTESCTTICQTCYEHFYDVDWNLYTSNNEEISIGRIDRQGLKEPSRWTDVQIGEPTAVTHSYTNYVKAAPASLFRTQGLSEKYKNLIPKYPIEIYDYYHVNRVVTINGATVDVKTYNESLSQLNANIGAQKQVNVVLVFVKDLPPEFFYALQEAWINGKKNDFVSVIGITEDGTINWVENMAWTDNKLAEVVVKDELLKLKTIDSNKVMSVLEQNITSYYKRKNMKDFEYLTHMTQPTTGEWIFFIILGLLMSVFLGIFFIKNDYDEEQEMYSFFKPEWRFKMTTLTKVVLGVMGTLVLLVLVGITSVISINNDCVQQEASLVAQYKQDQNNYDNMTKKIMEVAQVPTMMTDDLQKVTKAAIQGRYGKDGSKAVFQFIKEQNPTLSSEVYVKIQQVIEAGRNGFEANQKVLLDKKRVYETALNSFPGGIVAHSLGFPKIDLNKIDIVTSSDTEQAFGTKKAAPLKLRQ